MDENFTYDNNEANLSNIEILDCERELRLTLYLTLYKHSLPKEI